MNDSDYDELFKRTGKKTVVVPDLNDALRVLNQQAKPDDPPGTIIWMKQGAQGKMVCTSKEIPKSKPKQKQPTNEELKEMMGHDFGGPSKVKDGGTGWIIVILIVIAILAGLATNL